MGTPYIYGWAGLAIDMYAPPGGRNISTEYYSLQVWLLLVQYDNTQSRINGFLLIDMDHELALSVPNANCREVNK